MYRNGAHKLPAQRERERERDGEILGYPDLWRPWCQASLKRRAYRVQGSITGFPPNTGYNWCQKPKIRCGVDKRLPSFEEGERRQVVPGPEDTVGFLRSAPQGAKTEKLWNTSASQRTSPKGTDSSTRKNGHHWWSLALEKISVVCTVSTQDACHQPTKQERGMVAGSATTKVSGSFDFCGRISQNYGRC